MGLLTHHDPVSWRFYVYGKDDDGEPLFSFWMNIGPETGVCIYERNQGAGKWLSTHHGDEEYTGRPPSDELEELLGEVVGTGGGIAAERVHDLPDHERYFFQVIHGTIEQKGRAPPELMQYLMDITGTELRIE